MSLHLQTIMAIFLFSILATLGTRFTVVQLGASTKSNEVVAASELVNSDLAQLQADVKNLSPGEMDLGKETLNGKVYARTAVIEDGPHAKSYLVTLELKETSSLGIRVETYKMILFR